ncbi:hypothetical protein Scep_005058 [Stephania cephalantha]|uniref:Uncharacterized protein n=1 Tax=Stephania cephalantha TaxID=152367 RepID=A0AAP0PXU6_9MAGN
MHCALSSHLAYSSLSTAFIFSIRAFFSLLKFLSAIFSFYLNTTEKGCNCWQYTKHTGRAWLLISRSRRLQLIGDPANRGLLSI